MIQKIFGKYTAIASMAAMFVVGGLQGMGVIDAGIASMILVALGVTGAASASVVGAK